MGSYSDWNYLVYMEIGIILIWISLIEIDIGRIFVLLECARYAGISLRVAQPDHSN